MTESQPGPALDAAVARAIGWKPWKNPRTGNLWYVKKPGTMLVRVDCWHPPTNIADAMRAGVEMSADFVCGFDYLNGDNYAWATFEPDALTIGQTYRRVQFTETNGDKLAAMALAICRAIEKAGRQHDS